MTHIDPKHSVSTTGKLEWVAPQILEMSTALTDGKSYGGIEASPLEPPGTS